MGLLRCLWFLRLQVCFRSVAILGSMGLIAGIWADKYDQLAAFQNFIKKDWKQRLTLGCLLTLKSFTILALKFFALIRLIYRETFS